ncbi:putative zinc finger protein [Panacagrimonas perspica]|uniref:Putative zinc finger protein n=1 Tax=Panacagrimonas perspica TaxID=381431 RepID=A0A4S3JZ93_9GAMM|nr:zf-HC2 domain-containing protein [Panacagrimonas perspica]TDU31435.1 putative zinc finger protein [Panacagrimonas perspica]THD00838.1 hypothetical protein B1810_23285 [Panacagrimonas perspica]
MNCALFKTSLHDWLDGGRDADGVAALESHAGGCPACRALLAEERLRRSALRQLPVPPARPRFASEALQVARLADRSWRRQLRRHDMQIAAVAASAALAVVAFVLLRQEPGIPAGQIVAVAPPAIETYALTTGQVQSLRLRIEAPRDFEGVRFSVELPDHVSLVGQPGIRAMTWEGSLRKGPNVLELPLLAQAGAAGRMATRVSWGTFERHLEASLVSVPPTPGVASHKRDAEA